MHQSFQESWLMYSPCNGRLPVRHVQNSSMTIWQVPRHSHDMICRVFKLGDTATTKFNFATITIRHKQAGGAMSCNLLLCLRK